jgi:hypothetical protein
MVPSRLAVYLAHAKKIPRSACDNFVTFPGQPRHPHGKPEHALQHPRDPPRTTREPSRKIRAPSRRTRALIATPPSTLPDNPSAVPDNPSIVPDNPSIVPENPRTVPENPRTVPENPRTVPENPRTVPENPRSFPENPSNLRYPHRINHIPSNTDLQKWCGITSAVPESSLQAIFLPLRGCLKIGPRIFSPPVENAAAGKLGHLGTANQANQANPGFFRQPLRGCLKTTRRQGSNCLRPCGVRFAVGWCRCKRPGHSGRSARMGSE